MPDRRIPVIDLFAGPGGLGEGFASHPAFRISLSIEKDPIAHLTLELRAFFRQFDSHFAPSEYYDHLRGRLARQELFRRHPKAAARAREEAWEAELGAVPAEDVNRRIRNSLSGAEPWVLIGGPPCQAYSLVGRSRNKGKENYTLEKDPRATLYLQYLRIIAGHHPAAFVMENVRGLLSSKLEGEHIFHRMSEDLQDPARVTGHRVSYRYSLHSLTTESLFGGHDPSDFLIHCEHYGIPQARHRVIIVGIRDDVDPTNLGQLRPAKGPSVEEMIRDLPRLRSGLSKENDSVADWRSAVLELAERPLVSDVKDPDIREVIERLKAGKPRRLATSRGSEFMEHDPCIQFNRPWFVDKRLGGVCNHATRSHIRPDLHRYLFAAAFAKVKDQTPHLGDFPKSLLPDHRNILEAPETSFFADRFRVQVASRRSTTITSHIGKDGHYYIHYDPTQCRSLTVREAARLQTFPDNYLFCGPRTQQYGQVGNAVPPLLARQIADAILPVLG